MSKPMTARELAIKIKCISPNDFNSSYLREEAEKQIIEATTLIKSWLAEQLASERAKLTKERTLASGMYDALAEIVDSYPAEDRMRDIAREALAIIDKEETK